MLLIMRATDQSKSSMVEHGQARTDSANDLESFSKLGALPPSRILVPLGSTVLCRLSVINVTVCKEINNAIVHTLIQINCHKQGMNAQSHKLNVSYTQSTGAMPFISQKPVMHTLFILFLN